jgi:hypothetical protein
MNGLLETILTTGNGGAVQALAKNFGLKGDDALKAVTAMLPGLARRVQGNVSRQDGLDDLMGALQRGNHGRYIDEPETLGRQETIDEGNGILGHVLGSKDASRQLATEAAASTGLDAGVLKKMLPVVAAMMMGGLSKQGAAGGTSAGLGSGLTGMLGSLLDADKDGSVVDDLLGMAKRLF